MRRHVCQREGWRLVPRSPVTELIGTLSVVWHELRFGKLRQQFFTGLLRRNPELFSLLFREAFIRLHAARPRISSLRQFCIFPIEAPLYDC